MTLGEKLSKLRKEHNYTQEQLAELLGVSRQSISKWESDIAYPETDKLIKMGSLFDCSMDYLLKEEVTDPQKTPSPEQESVWQLLKKQFRERKSEKTVLGMPLYHIGKNAHGFFAIGLRAHGVISIGLLSRGIVSLGLLSLGILSFGLLSLGLLALGVFSLGAVAAGSVALGLLAAGAIAVGVISFGALSVGCFSVGALAVGQYAAVGDHAYACVAIGTSFAEGSAYSHIGDAGTADIAAAVGWLDANVPPYLAWAKTIFTFFIR